MKAFNVYRNGHKIDTVFCNHDGYPSDIELYEARS